MDKITLEELDRLAADPQADLSPYFVLDEAGSDAFDPRLVPNPDRVEIPDSRDRFRGPVLIPGANWLSRRRRRIAFAQKLASGYDGPVIVSEGDSWFQYPIRLEDTIDHLMRDFAVRSLGAAGDRLGRMAARQEYLRALEETRAPVLLLSAGGNDLLAGGALADHLEAFNPGLEPPEYLMRSFHDLVDDALGQYERIFRDVGGAFPGVRVLCHGYDYPVPDDGPWLGRPMAAWGIVDRALQKAVAVEMMDVFNRGLRRIARRLGHVTHIDCRGVVGDRWHDELHPTDEGYADVAALFAEAIRAAAPDARRTAPPAVRPEIRARSLHLGLDAVDPDGYAGWDGALKACENDAVAMERLASRQGFETRLMLTREATHDAVVAEVDAAASALRPGDMFLWTVSCHGTQVPDYDRDETDDGDEPMDEALMLFDRPLLDDDIHALWSRFAPGVRILMVPDTCHSGTMTRLGLLPAATVEALARGRPVAAAPRVRFAPRDVQARMLRENGARWRRMGLAAGEPRRPVRASVLSLSGCQDDQLARDGEVYGAFTEALLAVWDDARFRGGHEAFRDAVTERMGFADQVPKLYRTGAPDPTFLAQTPFTVWMNSRATVLGAPPGRPAQAAPLPAPSPADTMAAEDGDEADTACAAPPPAEARWGDRPAFEDFVRSLGLRHFAPDEFLVMGGAHGTPGHPGFGRNTPPPRALWSRMANTARVVDELREALGAPIVVTNAYRSPAYNAAVGGASASLHKEFNALDFRSPAAPPAHCAAALEEMRGRRLFSGGIGLYDGFVHVDTRGVDRTWRRTSRDGTPGRTNGAGDSDLARRCARIEATALLETRSRGPETPSAFAGDGADDALLARREEVRAVVDASSVVSFVEGLAPERKEDTLLSTLFTQRAASAAHDPVAEREEWLRTYLETLAFLGWTVEAEPVMRRTEMTGGASFERAVLDLLASVATGNQLAMLTAALEGLRSLGAESEPVRLFDLATSRTTGGHFQVGAAEAAGEVVSMALGAFHYEWTDERRNVLFVSWGGTRMACWIGAQKLSLAPGAYAGVRDLVRERLGSARRALLADVPLA